MSDDPLKLTKELIKQTKNKKFDVSIKQEYLRCEEFFYKNPNARDKEREEPRHILKQIQRLLYLLAEHEGIF